MPLNEDGLNPHTIEHVENVVLALEPGDIHKSYQEILDDLDKLIQSGGEPKSIMTDQ